jgi:transposase
VIDDVTDLGYWRARAEAAEARVAELSADKAELNARVVELAGQVAELTEHVATLSGLLFGRSSEKKSSGEHGDGEQRDENADDRGRLGVKGKRGQRSGRPGHGRRDYAHLETEERIIEVDPDQRCCASCGSVLESCGTEDSEQLDWHVKITRIVYRRRRYKRTCRCTGQPRTVCAPRPPKPISKGLFTAGFLARLVHEKYVLGRPVHRIIAALSAEGADVASGSLVGALKALAPLLAPWAAAIAAHGRTAGHVHADETSWMVFEDVEGKDSHRWWLWTFVTSDTVSFVIDPSHGADVAADHLGIDRRQATVPAGDRLVISSDFHKVYQSLAVIDGVDPLYCWSHIRRYFLRAAAAHPQEPADWAADWIERIAVLYRAHHAVAATVGDVGVYAQAMGRYERAFTHIDAYRRLQTEYAGQGLLHPAAAKVVNTLNNEWDGLARHKDLPQLPLDNNTAENALRTPVIGRKNFYGSGSGWAAELAADVWTVTATLTRNGIEPLSVLIDYLTACAHNSGTAPDDLYPFLPWTGQGRARRATQNDQTGPGP